MSDTELSYVRKDLRETIEIQDKGEREYPGTFPKLERYWDELHAVLGEINRRDGR